MFQWWKNIILDIKYFRAIILFSPLLKMTPLADTQYYFTPLMTFGIPIYMGAVGDFLTHRLHNLCQKFEHELHDVMCQASQEYKSCCK